MRPLLVKLPLVVSSSLSLLIAGGCAQDMMDEPRVESQEYVAAYPDGGAARTIPDRTVVADPSAMASVPTNLGTSYASAFETTTAGTDEEGYLSGKANGELVDEIPAPVLERFDYPALLARGRERFNIHCAPCHDRTGSGNGMVPRRGFPYPPSYHTTRLRSKPLGYFFSVATNGHGRMPPYGEVIATDDRWAIAAYVRALQLSQYAPEAMLSEDDLARIQEPANQATEGEGAGHE